MEWQPIETAPKDGRIPLLMSDPVMGVILGRWDDGYDDEGNLCAEPCWLFAEAYPDGDSLFECEPTHWMPLPSKPEAA